MAGTLRNLLVRVGADISGLSAGLRSASREVQFFGRNVTGSMKELSGTVGKAMAAIGGALTLGQGIQDAMRYEALMATLGESMGSSVKDFQKWQDQVGRSMGFSQLQAANTANILSLNFKKIAVDQKDLVDKTTKMMEVAAIVSNKRGMTMEEVSDRIRSAMNQEADGADELGVNVRAAALMQSQAYKEMGNNQPFDKLSEATRKTILYQSILEQVTANLGATMQDTTAARFAAFTASLADIRLALGQAFLPILYRVLPLLTMMANAIIKVLQVIAAFMRSLFGGGFKYKPPVSTGDVKTTQAQAAALGDVGKAADKAGTKSAKAAKKSKEAWSGTFGFDEVNAITDPKATDTGAGAGGGGGVGGGGGGGGGGGMPPIEMPKPDFSPFEGAIDELSKKFDKYTKPIKDAFNAVWTAISSFAKGEFEKISKWWAENGDKIIQAAKNVWALIGPIVMAVLNFIWDSVKMVVDGVIKTFMGIVEFFTGVFTGDWDLAWQGIKDIFFGVIEALLGFWNLSFIGGIKKLLFNFLEDGIKALVKFGGDFKGVFEKGFSDVVAGFNKFIQSLKDFFNNFGKWMYDTGVNIAHNVSAAFEKIGEVGNKIWNAIKGAFFGAVDWFLRTVINPIAQSFDGLREAFSKGVGEGFKYVINKAIDGFNNALSLFNSLKNATPFGSSIPDLRIPHLARGGITNGPTLAMVGDNAGGREVISPLDRLESMLTNSVIQAMETRNAQTGDIILNIDGRSFARIVNPHLAKENQRVGTNVRLNPI